MSIICVIVPVYNVEKYIHRCIDSILAQSFTDFELVLVDDGSLDDSGVICDEYAKKDNRIHVIHKENGGLSDARNRGIDWALNIGSSEWITFIDSDDWVSEKYLEILYEAVKSTQTSISCCRFENSHGENVFSKIETDDVTVYSSESFYVEFSTYAITACMKLYKKDLFKNIRFPVGKLNEDAFTTYKLIFSVNRLSFVNTPLYAYYQSSNSIMRSMWNKKKLDALEAFHEQIQYFHIHKFNRAYIQAIIMYANSCVAQMTLCESRGTEVRKAKLILKKLLRKHLVRYKKVAGFSVKQHTYYYKRAFPVYTKLYWFLQAVHHKLKSCITK